MDYKTEKRIYDIHSAFMQEYSLAKIGLSEFNETVTSFFSHVVAKNEEKLNDSLEQDIRSIQDVCFFLKTFCAEIQLHTQYLKSNTEDDTSNNHSVIEECSSMDSEEYKLPENANEIYPYELYPEIFTFTNIDLAEFTVGQVDKFSITYIKDATSLLFFMMKVACSDIVIEKAEFRYDIIPPKGTVFGIVLDGDIFRAVRETQLKTKPNSFKVLLIDVGEIIEVTKDYKMFPLTEDMQRIPGQAIFCKLIENDDDIVDNENVLRDKLYTKQNVRIERVYKNMLEVSLVSPSLPPSLPSTTTTSNFTTTTSRDLNLQYLTNDTMPNGHSQPTTSNNRNDSLTQEELDELYEEPFSTENALVAVMGYDPQDDKRICKFYDPKTNACFKGSHCKLEHTTKLKDGWTKDQKVVKLSIHAKMPVPKVGQKLNMFVQFVVDVDTFYGHIVPKNCRYADDLPAEKISNEMNTPEMKNKLKKLLYPPAEFELVFAMFKGEWYRAKILQKLSDIQYKVFYVDYGNCEKVLIHEMRLWEDEVDHHPFQAIECKLDNIQKLKTDPKGIAFLEKTILMQTVIVTVTSNLGPLLVTAQCQNRDVGQQMCKAQFATLKPITQFANGNLPG